MKILYTDKLSIGYQRAKHPYLVQTDLNLTLNRGEMICLIGPNGCGKSTLLRSLSGLQKSLSGDIYLFEKKIKHYSKKELALKVAMVLTDKVSVENATVWDIVSLGQQPYLNWLIGISKQGKEKIEESIRLVHLENKRNDFINQLSDGERQRVMIAKALAQDTPLIFLDEPTAHLDLPNRVEIMLLLHQLAHKTGKSIIISTHELDLALQAADRIWLMKVNDGVVDGVPEDLVLNGSFNQVFASDVYYFNQTNGNFSLNYELKNKINIQSKDNTKLYWTLRALARAGYLAVESNEDKNSIIITENAWIYNQKNYSSIEQLINNLPT